MKQIDKSKPILVTGANGFVASWLVKKLLEEGLTVHAAVRNPSQKEKVQHLLDTAEKSRGTLKLFSGDLLKEGSYQEAMEGCELVYHTASPFSLNVKDAKKDLLEPAEKGTANVLLTANKVESVKRVVVTSSCAAIYSDASDCAKAPNGTLNESIWNTTASEHYQPYSYSKTIAEKKAWEIAQAQSRWDLVTINPSFVMGPSLNTQSNTSESFKVLKQIGDGIFKGGAPRLGIGVVDVRDVAEAHFQAGFNPEAKGRYITSAHNTDLFEMTQQLRPKYEPSFALPKSSLPKWLIVLLGPLMDKSMNRKMLRNNVGHPFKADHSKRN